MQSSQQLITRPSAALLHRATHIVLLIRRPRSVAGRDRPQALKHIRHVDVALGDERVRDNRIPRRVHIQQPGHTGRGAGRRGADAVRVRGRAASGAIGVAGPARRAEDVVFDFCTLQRQLQALVVGLERVGG